MNSSLTTRYTVIQAADHARATGCMRGTAGGHPVPTGPDKPRLYG